MNKPTLENLVLSQAAKHLKRELEKQFKPAKFKVSIYQDGSWDIWITAHNTPGLMERVAEFVKDMGPTWHAGKDGERIYL